MNSNQIGDSTEIKCEYRQIFSVHGFVSDGKMPGMKHEFRFEGHDVVVETPPICDKSVFERSKHARFDEAAIPFIWDRSGEISGVEIYQVRVRILKLKCSVPNAVAASEHLNSSLFSESQRNEMDFYSNGMYNIANRCIHYCIMIIRWKADAILIDTPIYIESDDGDGVLYLI